jgi:ABC-type sugar transport system substrate-binding protein
LAAQYDGNEPLQGKLLGEYLVNRLEEEGNEEEFQVLAFTSFTTFASARQKTFEQAIKADPNIKIVAEKEVNPENSVAGTGEDTSALLNQYPHLGAIVAFWDDAIAGSASAVTQKYPGAQYPERPLLIGFDAIKTNQPWIARGVVDAVIDVDSNAPAWAMVDQTAGFFARQAPIAEHNPEYPGITLVEPQLITKENLPPEGTYVPPPFEPEAFFGAKWKAEYK